MMINGLRNFVSRNLGKGDDYSPPAKGLSDGARFGAVAGWAALTTGVGAAFGASRAGQDVVTVEHIPYPETVQVAVGTHESHGCYQYHYGYNMSDGEFNYHYGYDSSCKTTVTDYETQLTGRTLIRDVTHHSLAYPRTLLQGAMLGLGLGVATGIAGYVLTESIARG